MNRYLVIAILSLVALAVIYGLNRGIFIGSTSSVDGNILYKKCRYLFVTGISEIPARGAPLEQVPMLRGVQLANKPDQLYCRIFGD